MDNVILITAIAAMVAVLAATSNKRAIKPAICLFAVLVVALIIHSLI